MFSNVNILINIIVTLSLLLIVAGVIFNAVYRKEEKARRGWSKALLNEFITDNERHDPDDPLDQPITRADNGDPDKPGYRMEYENGDVYAYPCRRRLRHNVRRTPDRRNIRVKYTGFMPE